LQLSSALQTLISETIINNFDLTNYCLFAENLRREFGDKNDRRIAVDNVSVQIKPGEIIGLLGPNGAGKTTTVRMCATLLTPTQGRVIVDGIDAVKHPQQARKRIGLVLGGNTGFYARASARKNLLFFADVAGVRGSARRERVEAALDAVALTDRADDRVRDYSRGMTQRLHIARALLGKPSLLLLDEPTNGLDPQIAAEIRALIKRLADDGTGILLTSHMLSEVEQLANHIQVIAKGREIANGSVADIVAMSGLKPDTQVTYRVSLEGSYLAIVNNLDAMAPVETTGGSR
jgi:ABC-2 type transport system ATP-binding protein